MKRKERIATGRRLGDWSVIGGGKLPLLTAVNRNSPEPRLECNGPA